MGNVCKNCGTELKDGAKFCPECGTQTESLKENIQKEFCSNCGAEITNSENFCEECGENLNSEIKPSNDSFIEKYKFPIIVALIAIILLVAGGLIINSMNNSFSGYTLPPQTVTVGAEYFKIPGDFVVDPSSIDVKTESGIVSFSEGWSNRENDYIFIGIISTGYAVDLESVAAANGGVHKKLMGYDGYYTEDLNEYTFSFVLGDKVCMIGASSPYLYDEIEVL